MSQEIVVQTQPRLWLEGSILQPYVLRYGAHLRRGRYAPSTQRVYLCCVAHFAQWLTAERCNLNAIGEAMVERHHGVATLIIDAHLKKLAHEFPVSCLFNKTSIFKDMENVFHFNQPIFFFCILQAGSNEPPARGFQYFRPVRH